MDTSTLVVLAWIRSRASAVWVVATLLLLMSLVLGWRSASLRIPDTPVDRVNTLYAKQWLLLRQAEAIIPPGQGYTVIAEDKDEEMLLFELSLGVLPDRPAIPTSYWRTLQPGGDRARYVVSFECLVPPGQRQLVARVANGCVFATFDGSAP